MPGMPASTKKGGMCLGVPDVCLTPAGPSPVPIPYPNMAQVSGCDGTIDKVLMENKETVVEDSKISSSSGDEAGTVGGVMSGLNRGEVHFNLYSSKVYAQGKKIVFHTAMTTHNGSSPNLPVGAQLSPSQSKVIVAM
jgi:Domain of unknown function (DUF4150)